MELFAALFIVSFFVVLNEVRVALLGEKDTLSEVFILLSTIVVGVLFAIVA
ncbi:MAG: hypothetical protein U9Q33_04855 [Campylobacterota bacterium]|nr:hypothetical protein [Campylobacterota bacterium]